MHLRSHALRRPIRALCATAKPPYLRGAFQPVHYARYTYSTVSDAPPQIAVLGGGITGLSSAYHLAKEVPEAQITIYEAAPRIGGWMSSKHVEVDGGKILFEQGPRSLRKTNGGLVTAFLIQELGLEDELVTTAKDSPAARNRYIYYPDHLVKVPGPGMTAMQLLSTLWSEPAFEGVVTGIVNQLFAQKSDAEDESVGDFLSRNLGTNRIADNIASAVFHGIYAGDIYQLSARTLLPIHWLFEKSHGSILNGFWVHRKKKNRFPVSKRDAQLINSYLGWTPGQRLSDKLKGTNIYSFKDGISTLVNRMSDVLRKNPKVTFKTNTMISQMEQDQKYGKVKLTIKPAHLPTSPSPTNTPQTIRHDLVISTLSAATLSMISKSPHRPSPLRPDLAPAVTVCVVNLYYRNPSILPVSGFGYLLPRSVPLDQNPERALGVIFDSDAMRGQDTAPGTKVTVMLGGHWWNGYEATDFPSNDDAVAMARSLLQRHLGIDEAPAATNVSLQKDCIPQYTVGYRDRLKTFHRDLKYWMGGKVVVAGNSYSGVGVHDCIRAGRDVALMLGKQGLYSGNTGLEDIIDESWYRQLTDEEIRRERMESGE